MKTKLSLLFLATLLMAACGPKSAPTPAGTTSTSMPLSGNVDVTIAGFAFSPAELTIKVGTTIKWTNQDSAAHNITADDSSWGSSSLAQGDSFSFTFSNSGTFAYHCGVHPNMKATITVVP